MISLSGLFPKRSFGGLLTRIFPYFAALLLASVAGYSADAVLDSYLTGKNLETGTRQLLENSGKNLSGSSQAMALPSLQDFVTANPFGVIGRQRPVENIKEKEPVPQAVKGIDEMSLAGTLPGIGARIRHGEDVLFLLVGNAYGGYVLKQVEPGFVVFIKDSTEYMLPLLFSGQKKNSTGRSSSNPSSGNGTENDNISSYGQYQVSAPSNGDSGEVPRELVNQLLMNPFDELKKVRLRATFQDDDPLGMQVQWIANDSILKELGVQKGDIVSSVNGIPMNNMGDISNAINSLMGGTRFDVEVLRDGETVPLSYVVR